MSHFFFINFLLLNYDVGFHSINSEGMYLFHQKFAEGYIIVKYRSSSILVTICNIFIIFDRSKDKDSRCITYKRDNFHFLHYGHVP